MPNADAVFSADLVIATGGLGRIFKSMGSPEASRYIQPVYRRYSVEERAVNDEELCWGRAE